LIFCAIARSFATFDMRFVAKKWTHNTFIKTVFDSLFEFVMCLVENDVGTKSCTKAFVGLLVISVGNTYKNYLKIELVYPRAGDAIRNLTDLLDLNFNVLQVVVVQDVGYDKLTWLKANYYHLEIEETEREKHVREAQRWLKFRLSNQPYNIINELASVTSKNAWIVSMPYYIQLYYLNLINDKNKPLSCHNVKRLFAHEFKKFFFFNPKAEKFKWWTAKFLDHGLFEFWKRLESHMLTLEQHTISQENRSKNFISSFVEPFDVQSSVGLVHLIVFNIVIGILTAICAAIFLFKCGMQNAQAKLFHYSL
jgi:hypothetical protein